MIFYMYKLVIKDIDWICVARRDDVLVEHLKKYLS